MQHGFLAGAQACEKQVGLPKWLSLTDAMSDHLDDPAGPNPGLTDVLSCLFGTYGSGDVASTADLVINCHIRDLSLSLELALVLAMQRHLIAFTRQQEVVLLFLQLLKNGCWAW